VTGNSAKPLGLHTFAIREIARNCSRIPFAALQLMRFAAATAAQIVIRKMLMIY
jgi:hypothetical protein